MEAECEPETTACSLQNPSQDSDCVVEDWRDQFAAAVKEGSEELI